MNPLRIFKQVVSDFKNRIRNKFSKTLGIKTIGEYKLEIQEMLDDLNSVSKPEVIDYMVEQHGIQGAAKHYMELNKYYKEYYYFIIKEVKKADNTTIEFKNFAKRAEQEWINTYKDIIQYLYDKKYRMMYGDTNEDVKTYSANSFADKPLPWLRKENLDEDVFNSDYIPEGLFGATSGALGGAALAVAISSLSAAFHIHPKLFTGLSVGVGAAVGHFIQKHYFIDFTNYVKLKRYITHYPESFEIICDLMAKNAVKFQQKDPVKYKKILMNLKRLQQNPPEIYKDYLDDEIEAEDNAQLSGLFDVKDREGNIIKYGTSPSGDYSPSYNKRNRDIRRDNFSSRRALMRRKDYTMDDLTNNKSMSNDELAIKTQDLLGDI